MMKEPADLRWVHACGRRIRAQNGLRTRQTRGLRTFRPLVCQTTLPTCAELPGVGAPRQSPRHQAPSSGRSRHCMAREVVSPFISCLHVPSVRSCKLLKRQECQASLLCDPGVIGLRAVTGAQSIGELRSRIPLVSTRSDGVLVRGPGSRKTAASGFASVDY